MKDMYTFKALNPLCSNFRSLAYLSVFNFLSFSPPHSVALLTLMIYRRLEEIKKNRSDSKSRYPNERRIDEIQTRDNFLTLLSVGHPARIGSPTPRRRLRSAVTHPSLIGNFASWIFIRLNSMKEGDDGVQWRHNPFVFKLSARLIKASFFTSNLQ